MEAISLSIGVMALVGLFNNAVDCFNYVQVGRLIDRDSKTCLLRLQSLQLRLSRWGESIGLSTLDEESYGRPELQKALPLLEHIIHLFKSAEMVALRQSITREQRNSDSDEAACRDLDSLCKRLRDICIQRQRKFSLARKTMWALHSKAELTQLIDGLQALICDLVELNPPQRDGSSSDQELCIQEVTALRNEAALPKLYKIVVHQDIELAAALEKQTYMGNTNFENHGLAKIVNQSHFQCINGNQVNNL